MELDALTELDGMGGWNAIIRWMGWDEMGCMGWIGWDSMGWDGMGCIDVMG